MERPKFVLSEAEAAEACNLKTRTLSSYRKSGQGPRFVKIGPRKIGYLPEQISEWLADRVRASTSDDR